MHEDADERVIFSRALDVHLVAATGFGSSFAKPIGVLEVLYVLFAIAARDAHEDETEVDDLRRIRALRPGFPWLHLTYGEIEVRQHPTQLVEPEPHCFADGAVPVVEGSVWRQWDPHRDGNFGGQTETLRVICKNIFKAQLRPLCIWSVESDPMNKRVTYQKSWVLSIECRASYTES